MQGLRLSAGIVALAVLFCCSPPAAKQQLSPLDGKLSIKARLISSVSDHAAQFDVRLHLQVYNRSERDACMMQLPQSKGAARLPHFFVVWTADGETVTPTFREPDPSVYGPFGVGLPARAIRAGENAQWRIPVGLYDKYPEVRDWMWSGKLAVFDCKDLVVDPTLGVYVVTIPFQANPTVLEVAKTRYGQWGEWDLWSERP